MTNSSVDTRGNLGPRGRRQRLLIGVINLMVAGAVLYWMGQAGVGRWWRVTLFPVIWLGAIGLLQARARTCISHAARGVCDIDAGVPDMTPELTALFRGRAKFMAQIATIAAAVLTAIAIVV